MYRPNTTSRSNYYQQAPAAPVQTAPIQDTQNMVSQERTAIQGWLDNATVRRKFTEVLDKSANGFVSSLLSLVKSSPQLQEADPKTVMAAAMTAATLKLPINPNLGLAYIVPYKNKGKMEAQFQMGWKGYVQLAERTGQYKTINANVVYEGQIEAIDFITGEIVRGKKISDKVVGFVAYIKLLNGFERTLYMDYEEVQAHATKYSQSYRLGYGPWKDNFNAMALKTVLKLLISKYGIMSIDMQSETMNTAIASDQAVMREAGDDVSYEYVDNQPEAVNVTADARETEPAEWAQYTEITPQEVAPSATPAPEPKTRAKSAQRQNAKQPAQANMFSAVAPAADDEEPGF